MQCSDNIITYHSPFQLVPWALLLQQWHRVSLVTVQPSHPLEQTLEQNVGVCVCVQPQCWPASGRLAKKPKAPQWRSNAQSPVCVWCCLSNKSKQWHSMACNCIQRRPLPMESAFRHLAWRTKPRMCVTCRGWAGRLGGRWGDSRAAPRHPATPPG